MSGLIKWAQEHARSRGREVAVRGSYLVSSSTILTRMTSNIHYCFSPSLNGFWSRWLHPDHQHLWVALAMGLCIQQHLALLYIQHPFLLHWITITLSEWEHRNHSSVFTLWMFHVQVGDQTYCGLFAIAFTVDLCGGLDPHIQNFDNPRWRKIYKECFVGHRLQCFSDSCRQKKLRLYSL